ncbi:MAG: 3-dehydroquinate synthase [Armatimonadota bacterium]
MNTGSTVVVAPGDDSYSIHIGTGLLDRLGKLYGARQGQQAALITSDRLRGLYGERVERAMASGGWDVQFLQVPDGEGAKNLRLAGELCESLAKSGCDRGSVVFALGGGVIGDLAGFVAAIYMRGIDFVQLPTTLLAQADASVGGKVAVDLPEGKNLVGAFHQPAAVYIDTDTLRTLPDRHMRSGMAEVIKHAIIADETLFEFISENIGNIYARDSETLKHLLQRNCQIKVDVVQQDPLDTGLRAVLNIGHTIGHALERAAGDWVLHHGEAVAAGLVAETQLACDLGLCTDETLERIKALIRTAGITPDLSGIDTDRARAAMERDKKISDGHLSLPLVHRIGEVRIVETVDITEVQSAMVEALRSPR